MRPLSQVPLAKKLCGAARTAQRGPRAEVAAPFSGGLCPRVVRSGVLRNVWAEHPRTTARCPRVRQPEPSRSPCVAAFPDLRNSLDFEDMFSCH
jgi:hypothetical protein